MIRNTRRQGVSWQFAARALREFVSTNRVAEQVLLTPARREALIADLSTGRGLGLMVSRSIRAAQQTPHVGTSVYLYYDVRDALIYVGITDRGMTRNREHNSRAEWWQFVARQVVEHYNTRREAEARERELIRTWRPPFNKQHNPYYAEVRAEYFAWISMPPVDAADLARSLNKLLPLKVIEQDEYRLILSTHREHGAVAQLIRPLNSGEKITVAGHSARVVQTQLHTGLLLLHVMKRTTRFPADIAYGAAAIKFESQKPPAFRLTTVHVSPKSAGA